MKLAFQIVLLMQLVVFGTSSFSIVKLNAINNADASVSIVMSAAEYSDDADDAIRPSVLLTSVERSRDRRRTALVDKICYSQNVALASLSVSDIEKFYDILVNIPDNNSFKIVKNHIGIGIAREFSRGNVVLLI